MCLRTENTVMESKDCLRVCVFCSSSDHLSDHYLESAQQLGRCLADAGLELIYGGGNNGLMGALSQAMHESGGRVVGVITAQLKNMGYAYADADEMIVAGSMSRRKDRMERLADAFIAMPGGFGTLEEVLEIITLRQLGLHEKPIVLLDPSGFFEHLLAQFESGYREHFMREDDRNLYHVTDNAADAVRHINACAHVNADRRHR